MSGELKRLDVEEVKKVLDRNRWEVNTKVINGELRSIDINEAIAEAICSTFGTKPQPFCDVCFNVAWSPVPKDYESAVNCKVDKDMVEIMLPREDFIYMKTVLSYETSA